ncbi:hypothetical protein EJ08DRAFT_189211 [Tothia fuscella]|uniref:Uncharacterized protein n=1 Tax=Tothia fuscella TaxID=1048955 RepID=A0A9P4NTR3_9PEZI|nr:hypothetical protein EJ08DRAFT_189211 [Tothia fuscella]
MPLRNISVQPRDPGKKPQKGMESTIIEYANKRKAENEAKTMAEIARNAAEEKVRKLGKPRAQASTPSAWSQGQYAYSMYPKANVDPEISSISSSEDSRSTDTETATQTSGTTEPWPSSGTQSLHRVRVQQDDLDSDPSHRVIFPMRTGWKEHETKAMTKTMSRFGFQPLFEEVEAPCIPSQFYEIPGSGGCNLRGTALWQPPGPTLASELTPLF